MGDRQGNEDCLLEGARLLLLLCPEVNPMTGFQSITKFMSPLLRTCRDDSEWSLAVPGMQILYFKLKASASTFRCLQDCLGPRMAAVARSADGHTALAHHCWCRYRVAAAVLSGIYRQAAACAVHAALEGGWLLCHSYASLG